MIIAAAGGDEHERARFIDRYDKLVRSCLQSRWTRSRSHLIEDAAQEVFLECLKGGGILERAASARPPSFRRYLLGALRNVIRRTEQEASRGRSESWVIEPASQETAVERAFRIAWARMIVRHALATLRADSNEDSRRRADILTRRIEGLPIREIASSLGEPAELVHRAYARARRDLRRHLEASLILHEPSARHREARELENIMNELRVSAS